MLPSLSKLSLRNACATGADEGDVDMREARDSGAENSDAENSDADAPNPEDDATGGTFFLSTELQHFWELKNKSKRFSIRNHVLDLTNFSPVLTVSIRGIGDNDQRLMVAHHIKVRCTEILESHKQFNGPPIPLNFQNKCTPSKSTYTMVFVGKPLRNPKQYPDDDVQYYQFDIRTEILDVAFAVPRFDAQNEPVVYERIAPERTDRHSYPNDKVPYSARYQRPPRGRTYKRVSVLLPHGANSEKTRSDEMNKRVYVWEKIEDRLSAEVTEEKNKQAAEFDKKFDKIERNPLYGVFNDKKRFRRVVGYRYDTHRVAGSVVMTHVKIAPTFETVLGYGLMAWDADKKSYVALEDAKFTKYDTQTDSYRVVTQAELDAADRADQDVGERLFEDADDGGERQPGLPYHDVADA